MEVGRSGDCFDTSGMGEEKTLLLGRIVCLNCWHSSSAITTKGIRLLHTHTRIEEERNGRSARATLIFFLPLSS